MRFQQTCAALMGLASLVASAPTPEQDIQPVERGLKWRTRAQKRNPLTIIQEVQETTITIIEENLDEIAALEQVAEQQFAALVQAQVALITQLEDIKNNIRINHFKAKFSQVNVVIISVSTLIDARADKGDQKRYMVNQVLADNGKPDQEMVVMVNDGATMTIGAAQTASPDQASAASAPTASPAIAGFDVAAPFGQLNQSVILPAGAAAPAIDLVFEDPAAIILPNQNNLFVQSADSFLSDSIFYQSNGNSFLDQAAQIFESFEQLAAAQAAAIIINGEAAAAPPAEETAPPAETTAPAADPAVEPPAEVAPPAETTAPAADPAVAPPAEVATPAETTAPAADPAVAPPAEVATPAEATAPAADPAVAPPAEVATPADTTAPAADPAAVPPAEVATPADTTAPAVDPAAAPAETPVPTAPAAVEATPAPAPAPAA
ncbi:uncharacterized protein BCR38DRAFT_481043 [Pseudomassariella vexata]|uniref:Uncharacterized protein n=1 Tax=Pseudomassariella vexata TaxID=1141098 RepID=A0A1Y2EE85_9PEZI|nr:uncharacterized protein BCR38DRAFT_481043 [Pseudomassariella vexata]ORY69882.1 hypothetical protein BCR38DRAFT_481043 [Pseudomassariella vexata]